MSWPAAGNFYDRTDSKVIEKPEIDRFCDAMITIRTEIRKIKDGSIDPEISPLILAPHTLDDIIGDWDRPYSREEAGYPVASFREEVKYHAINRIDQVFGDRHLVCSCPPLEAYQGPAE